MQLIRLATSLMAISVLAVPVLAVKGGRQMAAAEIFSKRDLCVGVPCSRRSDCDAGGCDNGCNTNGRCHDNFPLPPPFCAVGCKINRATGQLVPLTERDIAAGEVPLSATEVAAAALAARMMI